MVVYIEVPDLKCYSFRSDWRQTGDRATALPMRATPALRMLVTNKLYKDTPWEVIFSF